MNFVAFFEQDFVRVRHKTNLSETWLPDGIFSNQKSQLRYILGGLGMENFGIFYGHCVFLKLFVKLHCRLVGIFCVHLVNF
jgi:hypothetical protein